MQLFSLSKEIQLYQHVTVPCSAYTLRSHLGLTNRIQQGQTLRGMDVAIKS